MPNFPTARALSSVIYEIYNTPQERQWAFFNSRAKYRLYGGQKGGGKSWAMRAEVVRQALSGKVRGLVLRRTTGEIHENMLQPMQLELPGNMYHWADKRSIMKFKKTGSTVKFGYCRNIKDVLQYQGVEFDFICIEELTHWTEREFKILMTSLRSSKPGIIPNFFGSTNPGGIGHGWVKRLWINRDFMEEEDPSEYEFIPASIYDNHILLTRNPEYLKSLLALPEKERRAYLEGDRDVFEGQFFTEFRRDIHIIEPMLPLEGIKRRIICLDYGFSNPSAVYRLAQTNQGTVYCYRELYKTGLTYKQLGLRVKSLTTADENIDYVIVDPAIVNKKSESHGVSGQEELESVGLKVVGGKNARVPGWNTVRQYLQVGQDPNTHELTAKLKITTNCSNLIRTVPELVHDDINVEDINSKSEDHSADALRYGLVDLGLENNTFTSISQINASLRKQNLHTIGSKDKRDSKFILNKDF